MDEGSDVIEMEQAECGKLTYKEKLVCNNTPSFLHHLSPLLDPSPQREKSIIQTLNHRTSSLGPKFLAQTTTSHPNISNTHHPNNELTQLISRKANYFEKNQKSEVQDPTSVQPKCQLVPLGAISDDTTSLIDTISGSKSHAFNVYAINNKKDLVELLPSSQPILNSNNLTSSLLSRSASS